MPDASQMNTVAQVGRRWCFAWCEFIETSRQLLVHGRPVKLEAKPLDVLQRLLEEPGRIHTKDELLGSFWPDLGSDQSLATAVSKLRKAFGGDRDDIILNLSGTGYRMAVPVLCVDEEVADSPRFRLQTGDKIPQRPNWRALKPLGLSDPPMVWLAEHIKTRGQKVFKFAADGTRLHALQREVSLSRFLKHSLPHDRRFVQVLDWNFEHPPFFLEAEFAGENLFDWSQITSFSAMPLPDRISLLAELAEAVAAAHSLGILHNDLKPGNVLIAPLAASAQQVAPGWAIKIADFGIATLSQPEQLRALQITYHDGEHQEGKYAWSSSSGSPLYRAPELLKGAAPSIPGDVYSLGVMLYQIACGDFLAALSPGWETRISDPLLRQDIAAAANVDPALRIPTAAELAQRLRTLDQRRARQQEQETAIANTHRAQKALAEARLRRPWIIFAIAALVAGLCASLLFYRRAARERDLAEQQLSASTAMFRFLSDDLIRQSNPFTPGAGAQLPQQTLDEAISRAIPQVDARFRQQPLIAARLHQTVAEALQNQTNILAADTEYEAAAQWFRQAQGPQSQGAIICELKRLNAAITSHQPGAMQHATQSLVHQQQLAEGIRHPSTEVRAWLALTQAAIASAGPHPEQALPVLDEAIRLGDPQPGLEPATELALRSRLAAIYLRMGDGPNAEKAARAYLASVTQLQAGELASMNAQMNLAEAFYAQGKNREAVEQIDQSYPRYVRQLGSSSIYTLQALSTRAAAEGNLGNFPDAIRDDLMVHDHARANPSAGMLLVASLIDAASSECQIKHFSSGLTHARAALEQNRSQPGTEPALVGSSAFVLAECLLSQQETAGAAHDRASLVEIDRLLGSINVESVTHFSANPAFPGFMDVARARLALAENNYPLARRMAAAADPYFQAANADKSEKASLLRVESAMTHSEN